MFVEFILCKKVSLSDYSSAWVSPDYLPRSYTHFSSWPRSHFVSLQCSVVREKFLVPGFEIEIKQRHVGERRDNFAMSE